MRRLLLWVGRWAQQYLANGMRAFQELQACKPSSDALAMLVDHWCHQATVEQARCENVQHCLGLRGLKAFRRCQLIPSPAIACFIVSHQESRRGFAEEGAGL